MKLKNLPNLITVLRIIGTGCLLFVEPFTAAFYVIYSLAGISDVVDGWIARKLKVTSEFGARLDSIADLMFYAVMVIRIFPVMWEVLPVGIWIGVGAVLLLRICAYIIAAFKFHRFASLHTYMNKATGASVFMIPYIIKTPAADLLCSLFCMISGMATVEELLIHIRMKEYNTNVKTIISKELHYGL